MWEQGKNEQQPLAFSSVSVEMCFDFAGGGGVGGGSADAFHGIGSLSRLIVWKIPLCISHRCRCSKQMCLANWSVN